MGAVSDLLCAYVCLSTGPNWPEGLIFLSKYYIVALSLLQTQCTCLTKYNVILCFTFLFSLFVFVSAAGQYNVIWTGTGLPRFRFDSGTVPALSFQIKSIIQQIVHVTSGHMAVYGPVRHQKNSIWTSEASVHIIFFW